MNRRKPAPLGFAGTRWSGGADFTDSLHSPTDMPFAAVPGTRALLEVRGRYGAAGDE